MPTLAKTDLLNTRPKPATGSSRSSLNNAASGESRKPLCKPPASRAAPMQPSNIGRSA